MSRLLTAFEDAFAWASAHQILVWTIALPIAIALLGYTGRDDSHITYYVADTIANGSGIINYSGDPIEQTSSLLSASVLALASAITGQTAAFWGPLIIHVMGVKPSSFRRTASA